jgi:hypothetical protein
MACLVKMVIRCKEKNWKVINVVPNETPILYNGNNNNNK